MQALFLPAHVFVEVLAEQRQRSCHILVLHQNVVSTTVIAYVVSAFCSFVVGIITCATVGQGTMDAGNSYEMYAVAASVIGGVSTLGGQGILLGTVVGAAIWGTLQNGLQFAGAPVAIRNIIIGIIVVLSVLMDVVIRTGRRNTKVSD